MRRVVTVKLFVDPAEYSGPDSNESAIEIAEAFLNGDADPLEFEVVGSEPCYSMQNLIEAGVVEDVDAER
jgi:hypothetical protein